MEEDILKKVARRQHHSVISPGVNFTNVLRAAFSQVDPKSVKNTVKPIVSFYTFGICGHKSCTQNVDEIEPSRCSLSHYDRPYVVHNRLWRGSSSRNWPRRNDNKGKLIFLQSASVNLLSTFSLNQALIIGLLGPRHFSSFIL